MTDQVEYPYADGDLLVERNTYFYSKYYGAPFIDAWQAQRRRARLAGSGGDTRSQYVEGDSPTGQLIKEIRASFDTSNSKQCDFFRLDRLLQRFEVTKRVHDAYGSDWRAQDRDAYGSLNLYLSLAELFSAAYERSGRLTYLNGLLKICDTLTSLVSRLTTDQRARLEKLLSDEAELVECLRSRVGGNASEIGPPPLPERYGRVPDFALLACDSARSRAYLQALLKAGLVPSEIVLLGEDRPAEPAASHAPADWKNVWLPPLNVSIADACRQHGIPLTRTGAKTANAPDVRETLGRSQADVLVYSGFGGEIVSAETLSAGPRFLHMHSGWVPTYRGSTTLYYALLNGDLPGVSAMFLDPGIDTGAIVARQNYPAPPAGTDLDHVYDTAIRADLLCRVLLSYETVNPMPQGAEDGCTYYVIHPVLKHIALLSLGPHGFAP
ncbi:MAG: formyltransferase family protein [Pseudomonadota bacterium]